ncbi:MAG: SUMF1/EgtB/PvdO family nonheme iron enzyme [Chloroflexota bacterium]|nr:SUMF1/EgtB/PvdO family nonheme iron enzyme [Chloroflexota bacterium]MDE2894886.1 SUMF1/EgtB/PvdO family nonheme iron enzyme [Chloroflexota bacterium]
MTADAAERTGSLIELPGGEFIMGADDRRRDERPAHPVRLATFRVAERPVSNDDYAAFIEQTDAAPPPFWTQDGFRIPDAPVVGISWHEAVAYCEWLSTQADARYRLPTEAEREYAARGGLEAADWPEPDSCWPEAACRASVAATEHPHVPIDVCRNGFGLYCMADNVHEWCSDWYDRNYYSSSPSAEPGGPASGVRRASRGGSWRHRIKFTRVSARSSLSPSYRYNDYGFRVYADAD